MTTTKRNSLFVSHFVSQVLCPDVNTGSKYDCPCNENYQWGKNNHDMLCLCAIAVKTIQGCVAFSFCILKMTLWCEINFVTVEFIIIIYKLTLIMKKSMQYCNSGISTYHTDSWTCSSNIPPIISIDQSIPIPRKSFK